MNTEVDVSDHCVVLSRLNSPKDDAVMTGTMSEPVSIVEASIAELSAALATGTLTSVELVSKYLLRIATYDTRITCLNSIPLLNQNVFLEAAASDDRRANGQILSSLDGIPFTVKDSYKVKGMTVASGSVAFQGLKANEDAFTIQALRNAGAVLIGKTNMCPMAYGGMLRGVYGRAESPYNADYLAAAFGSGSSNGSGVSVAASFAAFGMGEETVSSGRSPASNNGLVAYTPSRGIISIRGNWPLYSTCDVVVPHTRSVDDLCQVLNIITAADPTTTGDFWRDQPFVDLTTLWKGWPQNFIPSTERHGLQGKRIAVPRMYIEQVENGPYISSDIQMLWFQAQKDLVALGAQVELVDDLPVMTAYEQLSSNSSQSSSNQPQLPHNWNVTERGVLIAHAWEDFLQQNGDPEYMSLKGIRPEDIFPHLPRNDPQVKFTEPSNAVHWAKLAEYVEDRHPPSRLDKNHIFEVPGLEDAVKALEAMRVHYFEKWMDENRFDFVAFPAAGDVAKADSDINDASAEHAWTNGVKYSHGNRALRHLGIPSVTVCMGMLSEKRMPMGLTFLGRAYDDINIINAVQAYEQQSKRRLAPPRTPALDTDTISVENRASKGRSKLVIRQCQASSASQPEEARVAIEGVVHRVRQDEVHQHVNPTVDIFIDGIRVPGKGIQMFPNEQDGSTFIFSGTTARPQARSNRDRVIGNIARDSIMVMILARYDQELPTGYVQLIHTSEIA